VYRRQSTLQAVPNLLGFEPKLCAGLTNWQAGAAALPATRPPRGCAGISRGEISAKAPWATTGLNNGRTGPCLASSPSCYQHRGSRGFPKQRPGDFGCYGGRRGSQTHLRRQPQDPPSILGWGQLDPGYQRSAWLTVVAQWIGLGKPTTNHCPGPGRTVLKAVGRYWLE